MTTPHISLGFPPGPLALEAAELAERLGYHRIWSIGPGDGTWDPYYEMVHGTVLEPGESPHSERALDAAGRDVPRDVGGGRCRRGRRCAGRSGVARPRRRRPTRGATPPRGSRGPLHHATDRDRVLDAAGSDLQHTEVGEPDRICELVADSGEGGTTEIIYNPAGPDPLREIEAFAAAAL